MFRHEFLAALLLALAAPAAVAQQQEPVAQTPEAGAVMVIDGVPISADEYGRWMIDLFASRMARSFGEQHLVREAAKTGGIELPANAVDASIDAEVGERVEKAFKGDRAAWLDELRRTGWTEGGHREYRRVEVEPQMLATEMTRQGRVVPEELIRRDWELFYGPEGKEYALSGILIKVEVETLENSAREENEARRRRTFALALSRALDVRERALGGEVFAALAREYSDDPTSRAAGGRLDAKFRPPGWNGPFVNSILALGEGAISSPLYAKGGYWIVRVEGVVETKLESVRAMIEQRLIELGPESFEVGATWSRITDGMKVELLPELFDATSSPERHDPVVGLRVNGEPIDRAVFASWLLRGRGEHYSRTFAEHWLVERRAKELGLSVANDEIESRLRELQQRMIDESHKGSRAAWLAYLAQRGRDESGWRHEWERRVRIDLLCQKILRAERRASETEIVARWQQIFGKEGKWIEARMILVAVEPPQMRSTMTREELEQEISAARDRAQSKAEDLRARIDGGEDFAELARRFSSDDASRERGGKLPGRFRPDQWPEAVSASVMGLAPGALSPALDTGRGFAVFEVLSSRAVPYEGVAEALRAELENEPVPEGDLAGLRNVLGNRARVEVRPAVHGGDGSLPRK
jgi:parvulin-like peptidyl-prolyl isomerase